MKTVGLIGGMSWESARLYYQILNTEYRQHKGGNHSCPSVMYSFDFEEIERLQHEAEWEALEQLMMEACMKVYMAGAEVIIVCSNTMHKVTRHVERQFKDQFVHIADATATAIKRLSIRKVGLLGTKFTMTDGFYKERLHGQHGLEVVIPDMKSRELVHSIIYTQLVKGQVVEESKVHLRRIIESLKAKGAEGIVLGCTEIPMLIDQSDSVLPLFDTTRIHAVEALRKAMS